MKKILNLKFDEIPEAVWSKDCAFWIDSEIHFLTGYSIRNGKHFNRYWLFYSSIPISKENTYYTMYSNTKYTTMNFNFPFNIK